MRGSGEISFGKCPTDLERIEQKAACVTYGDAIVLGVKIMAIDWIKELGGTTSAVLEIGIAARMAIGKGGIVSYCENAMTKTEMFYNACRSSGLQGVYSGDQANVELSNVLEDIVGYGQNEDAEEIDVLGVQGLGCFFFGRSKAEADAKTTAYKTDAPYDWTGVWQNAKDGSPWQRLAGKIAIVTGSAQGFGDGVAREMVAAGAHMVIADLNYDLACRNAAEINAQYGAGMAIAAKVDVSDEESVKGMLQECVNAFGGLDIFVSNAGVLKAGGLEEMTLKDFEFVTKINYTAFFICTKYASEIMKGQHRFSPDYSMDILQINSKSGLEGSNRNFTYAGGKFGGIGLVESFAKELVGEKIKVNAICPGNFYEGPLWSDPEKGLFRQYLETGKVPGANTLDDVRDFYMAQVPMRRGCYPSDVARAIFYCVEQVYETGQAIPVTGGQVMLH